MKERNEPMFDIKNSRKVEIKNNVSEHQTIAKLDGVESFLGEGNSLGKTESKNQKTHSKLNNAIQFIINNLMAILTSVIASLVCLYFGIG